MKKLVLAAAMIFALPAGAAAQAMAVGPVAAQIGAGGGVPVRINSLFTVNMSGGKTKHGVAQQMGGLNYDVDVNFMGGGATLDFHPLRNGFLVAAGFFVNANELQLASTNSGGVVGGQVYSAAQLGQVSGNVTMSNYTPFVGVGYDTTLLNSRGLSFSIRAGAFFVGDANVTLTASGTMAGDPTLLASLQAEASTIENEILGAGVLPVVSMGVRYRF